MIELRDYQLEDAEKALRHRGYCLFHEQRTGKTPMGCYIAQRRAPKRLLIACPKIAIGEWEATLPQYDLGDCEVRIINFEGWWSQRRKLKKWQPDGLIIDEAHRASNRNSKTSRALRGVAKLANWILALTGTPTDGAKAETWEEMWAIFDLIDPSIFGPWTEYCERYLVKGGFRGKKIVGVNPLRFAELEEKFYSRFSRVLLEDIKPEKTDIKTYRVAFDLVESRSHYDSMRDDFVVGLDATHGYHLVKVTQADGTFRYTRVKRKIISARVITQAMKLHQLSGGHIKQGEVEIYRVGNEKLAHLGALVEHIGNEPVAIFVRFVHELYRIAALLRMMGKSVLLISGDNPYVRGSFTTDVVVIQIRSGVAVDLARAHHGIFYSWDHSLRGHEQAKMRIRSYWSNLARYYYLIANDTIDEDLFDTVIEKKVFSQLIIDKYRRK